MRVEVRFASYTGGPLWSPLGTRARVLNEAAATEGRPYKDATELLPATLPAVKQTVSDAGYCFYQRGVAKLL
ncbi:MAG TPA: hypothetical protein VFB82_21635, partial [Blastocatellia bacterium]|nr:hypothetical protein [Blastocatellia bacterium]